jgi:hypothetical protein
VNVSERKSRHHRGKSIIETKLLITTNNKMMKYILIAVMIFSTFGIFSQDIEKEEVLLKNLKRMNYYKYEKPDYDSLAEVSALFGKLLFEYVSKDQSTLENKFENLTKEGLIIADSDDKEFRIYSWDTQTGGTMRIYENIFQYSDEKMVYSKQNPSETEGDPKSWYSKIYTLTSGKKIYYLGINHSDYSTSDKSTGIRFFSTQTGFNDTLKLIKTEEGLSNGAGIGYNFFSVVDRPERPLELIKYDPDNKTISIPIVKEEDGSVTDKYDVYRFNDDYFEVQK